jgi:hypothetical protein
MTYINEGCEFSKKEIITTVVKEEAVRHYKNITFFENRDRVKLLNELRYNSIKYFENSTLNMESGEYDENSEAVEARNRINLILVTAYKIIRLADIKTAATSSSSLIFGGQGKNIDLILNMFNLGRNNIPASVVIDYIEKAIDVYNSDRLYVFFRTINPFFWLKIYSSDLEKRNLTAPHTGHTQSSGKSSNAVPGAMPRSGSPFPGS